jgi:hypothetical protein
LPHPVRLPHPAGGVLEVHASATSVDSGSVVFS